MKKTQSKTQGKPPTDRKRKWEASVIQKRELEEYEDQMIASQFWRKWDEPKNTQTSQGKSKKTMAFVHGYKIYKHVRKAWIQHGAGWVLALQKRWPHTEARWGKQLGLRRMCWARKERKISSKLDKSDNQTKSDKSQHPAFMDKREQMHLWDSVLIKRWQRRVLMTRCGKGWAKPVRSRRKKTPSQYHGPT